MKTFNFLNSDFRKAFKEASKKGKVRFTIDGIKNDPDSIYPMFEVTNEHVTYYSVEKQCSIVVTNAEIKAVIY